MGKFIPDFLRRDRRYEVGEPLFNYRLIWLMAVLGTSIVSLIPLVIMGVWNYRSFQMAMQAERMMPMQSLISNAQQTLSLYVDERDATLRFMVEDNRHLDLANEERLHEILEHLRTALGDIVDLGVISEDGTQVAYVGPYDLKGINYSEERWFREVCVRGIYVSEVFLGFRDFPHIVIAAKHEAEGNGFFVMRMTLDMQRFNEIIRSLKVHPSGELFLSNERGVIQSPPRRFGDTIYSIAEEMVFLVEGPDVFEVQDEQGRDILMGCARVRDTPFFILATQPHSRHTSGSRSFMGKQLLFLGVSGVLILLVTLRISTLIVGKIETVDRRRLMFLHKIEHTNKMASIGRLAAGVAHEVNNPLAIIDQKAGLLKDLFSAKDPSVPKEKLLSIVDSILRSVDRCSRITYRLLGFARHIDVQPERIDMAELIREVIGFLEKEAEHQNIHLTLDTEEGVPTIMSDKGQLSQVFLNILNNAIEAVRLGGNIRIAVKAKGERAVVVSFRDDGEGIPPEHLQRVFEPFFTTKGRSGTGLGLSITYGIVKKLGGKIKVESEEKRGTCISVTLPVEAE